MHTTHFPGTKPFSLRWSKGSDFFFFERQILVNNPSHQPWHAEQKDRWICMEVYCIWWRASVNHSHCSLRKWPFSLKLPFLPLYMHMWRRQHLKGAFSIEGCTCFLFWRWKPGPQLRDSLLCLASSWQQSPCDRRLGSKEGAVLELQALSCLLPLTCHSETVFSISHTLYLAFAQTG